MEKDYHSNYRAKNRELLRKKFRTYSRGIRRKLIKQLGNKCIKCGFDDWRALQVDHINGGGVREHRKIKSRVKYMRKVMSEKPGKYQLLCANCNWIKRYENKEHRKD